jgi:hypothetical protein
LRRRAPLASPGIARNRSRAVLGQDAHLMLAFEQGMASDQGATVEDVQLRALATHLDRLAKEA